MDVDGLHVGPVTQGADAVLVHLHRPTRRVETFLTKATGRAFGNGDGAVHQR